MFEVNVEETKMKNTEQEHSSRIFFCQTMCQGNNHSSHWARIESQFQEGEEYHIVMYNDIMWNIMSSNWGQYIILVFNDKVQTYHEVNVRRVMHQHFLCATNFMVMTYLVGFNRLGKKINGAVILRTQKLAPLQPLVISIFNLNSLFSNSWSISVKAILISRLFWNSLMKAKFLRNFQMKIYSLLCLPCRNTLRKYQN